MGTKTITYGAEARVEIAVNPPTHARLLQLVALAVMGQRPVAAVVTDIEAVIIAMSSEAFYFGLDTALDVCTDVRLQSGIPLDDEGVTIFHRIERLRNTAAPP